MCRVNYDKENWRLIAEALLEDHTSIHVINRAQVQSYIVGVTHRHTRELRWLPPTKPLGVLL